MFREVLDQAGRKHGLAVTVWRQRDLLEVAVRTLGQTAATLNARLVSLKSPSVGAWQADHKHAALAAWMEL